MTLASIKHRGMALMQLARLSWQRLRLPLLLASTLLMVGLHAQDAGAPAAGGTALPQCADPGICFLSQQAKDQWAADNGCQFAPEAMTFSSEGIRLLKDIERLRLNPYDDQTGLDITEWVEGATIGYGHLILQRQWDMFKDGITEEQASQLFQEELAPVVNTVNDAVTVDVTQQQFDAMVMLGYNIGERSFAGSSVVKLVNDPDAQTFYASLEAAWKAWNKSQGQINQGLINRRNAEWNIYTDGIYERW